MKLRLVLTLVAVILAASAVATAQHTCFNSPAMRMATSDGRVSDVYYLDSANDMRIWFYVSPNHSYSVEVNILDDPSGGWYVYFSDPSANCPSADSTQWHHTEGNDPRLYSGVGARRASITATTSGFFDVRVGMNATGSHPVTYRVTDTTMYNPRWTTWAGFNTNWGFKNTTSQSVQGTLRVYRDDGTLLATSTFLIPAKQMVQRFSGVDPTIGLSLAVSQAGGAEFTHDGPPGAVLADTYYLNAMGTVVVPSKFEVMRAEH